MTWSEESMVDGRLCQPEAWRVDDRSSATIEILHTSTTPGGGVLQLTYAFAEEPGERVLLLGPHLRLGKALDHVSVYVHGYTSLHILVFFVVDASGEYHSYRQMPLDWTGWRRLQFRLTEGFRAHWGGNGSGSVDFPVRRAGFVLWREDGAYSRSGRLLLGGLHFHTEGALIRTTIEDAEWLCALARGSARAASPEIAARVESNMAAVARRLASVPTDGSVEDLQEAQDLANHCRYVGNWLDGHVATETTAQPSPTPLAIGHVEPLSKVRPFEFPQVSRAPLLLDATRGEWTSAQMVVGALDEPLSQVELKPRTLLRQGGGAIPGHLLECYPVGLVELRRGTEDAYKSALWPDPLLPSAPIDIKPYTSRSILMSLPVPAETRPGLYDGEVAVLVGGKQVAAQDIELQVRDLVMPFRCTLPVVLGLNTRNVGLFYGADDLDEDDYLQWVRFLLDRRMHADRLSGSYHWTQPPKSGKQPSPKSIRAAQSERFDLHWAARVSNQLLALDETKRQAIERKYLQKLPSICEDLRDEGVLERSYLYTYDELGAEDYERVIPFLSECRRVAPELKVVLCFFTGDPLELLGDYVDVWCPHMHWVAGNSDKVKSLQDSGKTMWWYFTEPQSGLPGVTIDAPTLTHRILFWMTFHYGFEGLLHWETTFWGENMWTKRPWPARRWVGSVLDEDTGDYIYHGNGYLLYPGPSKSPLSSLRLESMRRGAEDYELLRMLRKRLFDWDIPSQLAAPARSLLDLSDLIRGLDDFETDSRHYDARRKAIIDILEQARSA